MAARFFELPRHSETHSSSKTQNFAVKLNCKNRFTFHQKNSEYAIRKQKKIGKNGKNLSHISGISLGKFVANKRKSQIEIRFANGILC